MVRIQHDLLIWFLVLNQAYRSCAWTLPSGSYTRKSTALSLRQHDREESTLLVAQDRRTLVESIIGGASILLALSTSPPPSQAAVRAIGGGEQACRQAGNCLEVGEYDGAIGWTWGGKDRCDPADPKCGADGQLREGDIVGKPVPTPAGIITDVAAIRLDVGRAESSVIRVGLYGNDCPDSVNQLVQFLSPEGLSTAELNQNTIASSTVPVTLSRGGVIDVVTPGLFIDFGVTSQEKAYARSLGRSKPGDSFIAQPRPKATQSLEKESTIRSHDAAGLVSIPRKGLGYGGTGFESDDEAFESAFLITAGPVPSLDRSRRVVGQLIDASSMSFLERLANLPTKKGLKGVIPGQSSGPPLLKVVVREIAITKVTPPP